MNVLVFRHVPYEGLGTIELFLKNSQAKIKYCDLFLNHSVPSNPSDYDFVISMGGPMNVDETDKFPFLLKEREFIKKAVESNIPVTGICLGAQLIARALGAPVYPGAKKEIGWYPIELTNEAQNDAVFKSVDPNPVVFHWHGDTFDLPKGATLLASSELFKNQAFRFGPNVYAFQFHIEVTPKMIEEWVRIGESELKSAQINEESILNQISEYESSLNQLANRVYPQLFSESVSQIK